MNVIGRDWRKRAFDIVVSFVGLVLLWPLLAAIAVLLLVSQGPPVLYKDTRVGIQGRRFVIYKFRTMRPNASEVARVASSDDPLLTFAGRKLKPSRLDELPQLINVLKGDMSLVGPRPLPPAHLEAVEPSVAARLLSVRPGLTGPAAIPFIAEDDVLAESENAETTYVNVILPAKIEAQLGYAESWSLAGDLKILLTTVISAWSPKVWRRSRDMIRALVATQP